MRKILVSECLYGGRPVRYDGGEKAETDQVFLKWKEEGRLVPVCPEVFGGLPIPRPEAQRIGDRVMNIEGKDVTEAYQRGAAEALRLAKEHDSAFCILKQGSPACGSRMIHDGTFSGRKIPGQGVAAELLRGAGFTVFGEDQMDEAAACLAQLEQAEQPLK